MRKEWEAMLFASQIWYLRNWTASPFGKFEQHQHWEGTSSSRKVGMLWHIEWVALSCVSCLELCYMNTDSILVISTSMDDKKKRNCCLQQENSEHCPFLWAFSPPPWSCIMRVERRKDSIAWEESIERCITGIRGICPNWKPHGYPDYVGQLLGGVLQ